MKIIIAGGMGYIGSAIAEIYRNQPEHEIIMFDKRFIPERVAALPKHIKYIQADMQDKDTMRTLLEGADVLHLLAAEVEAEKSIGKVEAVWDHNYHAPIGLLEVTPPTTRVMFASTGNIFGGVDESVKYLDLNEEDTPAPKLPYAETKVAMEKYLRETDRDYVVCRFGTNYGFSPGVRFNLVTNIFVQRTLLGKNLTIHGKGENFRPTVCVNDCARALEFLAKREDASKQTFHVVNESFKIRELGANVVRLFGDKTKLEFVDKVVPFSAYALSNKKIRDFGFEFAWNLESAVLDMKERFSVMEDVL